MRLGFVVMVMAWMVGMAHATEPSPAPEPEELRAVAVEGEGSTVEVWIALPPSVAPGSVEVQLAGRVVAIRARDETEMMTLCTVRRAPEELAALFATEPMSEDETGALRTLGPVIGGCLANGQTLRLDRAALRAMLALSAYRLIAWNESPTAPAVASSPAPPSG